MAVIHLENIKKSYQRGSESDEVLHGIDLQIEKGEFVAVMGPSGSGKSTLMNLIGLLDTPSSGIYKIDGKDVSMFRDTKLARIRRKKIGFIFQSFNLLPRLTVLDNVMLPMAYMRKSRSSREKRASKLLKQVGLDTHIFHAPNELSGGQMQRVAIARSLANRPSVALADEPTGNLDSKTGTQIMDLLAELHKEGNTIVMVTHDTQIAEYANRTIELVDGVITKDTTRKSKTVSAAKTATSDETVSEDKPQKKKSTKRSRKKKKSQKKKDSA